MASRSRYNFWIDDEQRGGLRFLKERDGILESEQIRRAIDLWLVRKGIKARSERKRVARRARSQSVTLHAKLAGCPSAIWPFASPDFSMSRLPEKVTGTDEPSVGESPSTTAEGNAEEEEG